MNITLKAWVRLYLFAALAAVFAFDTAAHAQSYAEGVSEVLNTTTSTDLYTYTNTFITYDLTAYYAPSTQAQLLDNGTQIAYRDTQGPTDYQDAELDGHVPNLRTGDDYEVDGAHFLFELYTYYDPGSGNTYYENPSYYGFTDGYQSTGYDYTGGGGDYYTVESEIFLGYTASAISTAVPQITGISPAGAAKGASGQTASGQITVTGSHLVDAFDGSTTPNVLSGSGLSLTTGSLSATQVTLNYSIDPSASTGASRFTLSNRFGPSEPQTFTVGDPSPVVSDVEPHIWPAGTVTPLIITGSGFGIAPTVTIVGVGVLTPSPLVTGSTDNSISTSVSIALDAPNGPAAVTVQSHGSGGSGFVQGTPGQSSSGSNSAVIQAVLPAPAIIFRGRNIAGNSSNPASIVAGQQVILSVYVPSPYYVTGYTWSFGSTSSVSGGYSNRSGNGIPTHDSGAKTAPIPPTTGDSLTYYYIVPGNAETINVTYSLDNGEQQTADAHFSVTGPTNAQVAIAQTGVQLYDPPISPYSNTQFFANEVNGPGITFTATSTNTGGGNYRWVQLINHDFFDELSATGDSGLVDQIASTPELDGSYPYGFHADGTPIGTVHLRQSNGLYDEAEDSPAVFLGAFDARGDGEMKRQFNATMWLEWVPTADASCTSGWQCFIPVPLETTQWGYTSNAINTLQVSANRLYKIWVKSCGDPVPGSVNGTNSLPTWDQVYGDLK